MPEDKKGNYFKKEEWSFGSNAIRRSSKIKTKEVLLDIASGGTDDFIKKSSGSGRGWEIDGTALNGSKKKSRMTSVNDSFKTLGQ